MINDKDIATIGGHIVSPLHSSKLEGILEKKSKK